jgi:hypothetical protein
MPRQLLHALSLIALSSLANAQTSSPPQVPDAIKAPAGEKVVLQAHASGFQIYTCQAGTDGKLSWTLKAPEAELRDAQGRTIGRHFAGPAWQLNDGSQVTGKLVARVDSPDADAIPWLLLSASAHAGNGALSRVTTIQRIHTQGGKAPLAGCDAAHRDAETKIIYAADYYFYAPAP